MQYNRQQIVFVDEAGFNISMRRTRGWSAVNTAARVSVPFTRSKKNLSFCAAITANGPVLYEIRFSAYNTAAFGSFTGNLIQKLADLNVGSYFFIMDQG